MNDSLEHNGKRIVIAVHEAIPIGPAHDLRTYLLEKKVESLLFIAHPLTYIKEFYKSSSRYEMYEKGKLKTQKSAKHWRMPDVFLYAKDTLYTIVWCIQKEKSHIFFGVDPLNAFAGILLRVIGRTDKVVYYSIDYFTKRFDNPVLNKIYHSLDKFCVRFSDETWNLSKEMKQSRKEYNKMSGNAYNRQRVVPIGVWYSKVKRLPFEKINRNKIIFIGSFTKMMGIECIVDAAPQIKKIIPRLKVDIIGSGPEYNYLVKKAKKMNILRYVHFHGWVSDKKKIQKLMIDGAIGLAPFDTTVTTDEIKNADPAKLKDYMLWGMPVVVTEAISNLKELEQRKCAFKIVYSPESMTKMVAKLLTHEKLLITARKHALEYIQEFDYEMIFSKNMKRIYEKR